MPAKKLTQRKAKGAPKRDDSFEAVAQRLECDTDETRFREKLGKIARSPKGSKVLSRRGK